MSDKITKTVTHEFQVVPFTRYAVVYNTHTSRSEPVSIGFTLNDKAICVCATEEEAKQIAGFLASAK